MKSLQYVFNFTVARLPVQAVARPMSRHEPGTRMSVLLANPDYLLEGFAEKKCQVRYDLLQVSTGFLSAGVTCNTKYKVFEKSLAPNLFCADFHIERFQHVITIPYTRNEPPFWCTTCTV